MPPTVVTFGAAMATPPPDDRVLGPEVVGS